MSAILMIDEAGRLAGARDVVVAGQSYGVVFADGSCAEVFGSCTNGAFTFRTEAAAAQAARALLDQVFVDTMLDNSFYRFDQVPSLTVGCGHVDFCLAAIPVETAFNGSATSVVGARNAASNSGDFVTGPLQITAATSQTAHTQQVYARFTPAVSAVPEPATWATMLAGFGAIGATMRGARGRAAGRRIGPAARRPAGAIAAATRRG